MDVLLHTGSCMIWKAHIGCTQGSADNLKAWIVASLIFWAASEHKHANRGGKDMNLSRDSACSLPLDSKTGTYETKLC